VNLTLTLFLTQLTIDLPFVILNDRKSLYGTGDEIIQHYKDFHLTMNLIEQMETTDRLNSAGF
jgi:hypothetical protein